MKLLRVGQQGHERPAILLDEENYLDLSSEVHDYNEAFFASGGIKSLPAIVEKLRGQEAPQKLAGQRIGSPIARPHQILCIGLNYSDHAAETGQAVPNEPIVFNKSPNTLIGPNDDVVIPRGSTKTDWEVELGIVMGKKALYLKDEKQALEAIAGYTLVNDVSEREWQIERGGQWVKGKSAPTFNPAGPYLVTPDEIPDVSNLPMTLTIDGKVKQNGSTATMLFSPTFIVHYVSQFMQLEPGDLINTGTPPGVGMGSKPPAYLVGGETMVLTISHLGTQTQRVKKFE
jgi:2-keto-4-pentenoate hydratase/2-oxohepta-3-ene-1,7-dioic acid hydratase in catechol pathway